MEVLPASITTPSFLMARNSCPTHEQLRLFSAGLSTSGSDLFASHLDECQACQDTISNINSEDASLALSAAENGQPFAFHHELAYQRVEASLRVSPQRAPQQGRHQPSRLGDYEILEQTGQGGMGAVFKARHVKLDRLVALKVLSHDRLRDEDAVTRFHREMNAVGRLDHPNIVSGYDAGEVDGEHFLVMELLDGVSLSALIDAANQLQIPDACELVRQACLGLHQAHEQGMIHRDVKPSNLMLCRNARGAPLVKVLDMGLARFGEHHQASAGLTGTGQIMGTLEFMAPEQGADSSEVDRRADIYSVGGTLYKLLCGHAPYDTSRYDTQIKLMQALANDTPASVGTHRNLPTELVTLIDSMLSRAPEDRPATLLEVAESLQPLARGSDLQKLLADGSELTPAGDTDVAVGTLEATRPAWRDWQAVPADAAEQSRAHDERIFSVGRPRTTRLSGVSRWLLTGTLGSLLLLLLAVVLLFQARHGVVRVEINDPAIEVTIDGESRLHVKDGTSTFEVTPGTHRLSVKMGETTFQTDSFEVNRSDELALRVALLPDAKVRVTRNGVVIGENQEKRRPSITEQQDRVVRGKEKTALQHSERTARPKAAVKTIDANGDWALQFGSRSSGVRGAGFGFVARDIPIPRDQDFTIELWCRLSDRSREQTLSHPPFSFGVHKGRAIARHTPADRSLAMTQILGPVITNRWVHRALVVEGAEMRQYVNGVLSGSAIIPQREDTWSDMPHFGLKTVGELDEVRISNVARYGTASFTPEHRFVPDEATLGLFHLDEGQGVDLTDASGHTVGSFATDSNGFARLAWVKADGPTASEAESEPPKAAGLYQGPPRQIRFGDTVNIVASKYHWLAAAKGSWVLQYGQRLQRVISMQSVDHQNSSRTARIFDWTICSNMKAGNDSKSEVVNYGDSLFLSVSVEDGRTEWLTGNRSPHDLNSFGVFASDASSEHEKEHKLAWYSWQIRKSPEAAGSGPVSYGSLFYLACKYYNSDIGYDGFSFLSKGRGEESGEVHADLLKNTPSDRDSAENYTWQILPDAESAPPETNATVQEER